jgi:tetratricopeptide (TPR) repeat protein
MLPAVLFSQAARETSIEETLHQAEMQKGQSASRALLLAEHALSLARQSGNPGAEARALNLMGDCQVYLGKNREAEQAFQQSLQLSQSRGMVLESAESSYRLAKVFMATNRYEKGVAEYLKAYSLAESAGSPLLSALIDNHLGIANFVLKNRERALALCQRALTVLEKSQKPQLLADGYEHLGIIYSDSKDWNRALDFFRQALEIRERDNDRYLLAGTLGNFGMTLHNLGRSPAALPPLTRALDISKDLGDTRLAPFLHMRLGQVEQKLNHLGEALLHFEEALRLDRKLGDKRKISADLLVLSHFHHKLSKDYLKALQYLEEYSTLIRQVYNEETGSRIAELQAQYDADRKQREIELLQRDRAIQELTLKRQAIIRNAALLVALFLVIFLGVTFYHYRREARTSRELRNALLKVRTLQGLLPICAQCKKIRDDQGYWKQVEQYVSEHTEAQFSHGLCPECVRVLYPELVDNESTPSHRISRNIRTDFP